MDAGSTPAYSTHKNITLCFDYVIRIITRQLFCNWEVSIMPTMLMYGKEASNRKQEIDRQHHTIPNQRNQRPKDKHRGNVYNLLFRHGKVRSQNMEKLKCSFPTFCKQTFPQLHKTASYAHYAQCRLLRNPTHHLYLVKIAKNILIFIYDSYIMYSTLHFGTNI